MLAAGRTALIVYAHQSPTSFNSAACKAAAEALEAQGCKVLISDLYAMNFEASATTKDIIGIQPFYYTDIGELLHFNQCP